MLKTILICYLRVLHPTQRLVVWDSALVSESTVMGTRNLLEMLERHNNQVKYVNTSSGAVKKVQILGSNQGESINDVYANAKLEVEKILTEAKDATKITFLQSPAIFFRRPRDITERPFCNWKLYSRCHQRKRCHSKRKSRNRAFLFAPDRYDNSTIGLFVHRKCLLFSRYRFI